MDVNSYCKIEQNYIVGEFTLLRFNVKDGIKETYHEIINPGKILISTKTKYKFLCYIFLVEIGILVISHTYMYILDN